MHAASTAADIPRLFEAAWNAHDMTAFAALFHPDASFVNRFGTYWRGVDAIVAGHRTIHETIYSDSTLVCDPPNVDPIGEDAAILHVWSRLTTGKAHPAGPHVTDTLLLIVVTRRGGAWRIQAAENVTLVDPRTGVPRLRDR
ncbi:MAG: SgcJ/EcaC family oxidoreductase [Proteobacteria bacterium]|nr:SgcJ/EcaC family oxidoreductase [Pseudomonadota bacterium]